MKVAICISGQARLSSMALKLLLKNVIGNNEVDIFIHSWSDSIDQIVRIHTKRNIFLIIPKRIQRLIFYLHDKFCSLSLYNLFIVRFLNYKKRLISIFKPKAIKVESWYSIKDKFKIDESNFTLGPGVITERIFSLFYSLREADLLRRKEEERNNFKYDLVIRTRFDLLFLEKLDLSKIRNDHLDPFLLIPIFEGRENQTTDIFAIGDSLTMSTYSDIYIELNRLINENNFFAPPEALLQKYISDKRIRLFRNSINFRVHRQIINIR